ncbi:MAG: poly-gamma-glutamate biosynthesis protein PgsC/CapC [Acidimicrobiia bacterium]|nr:poly-gamma-glutamate biosynthesis protein PgsC/CapC [Acidimicrobiia bacterium]MDH4306542.1 poly-gamma-glutamate biosynthesis protein PgsC/CapC [Acidimicrobiia bacterium]MDH5295103.1 poly-gamma-glutamate biosynthesis protein PgsC/CapC [Acidimicrobiia bacterium]
MHDYLFSIEVVRFAFVAGIVVSMVLYERRHVTTGSIVVPGYIAIFLIQPLVLLATAANAMVSYLIVNKVLPRWFLLYGRTKFAVLVGISTLIQAVMLQVSPAGSHLWESSVPLFVGAGYVVPALIAHDMARQGLKKTLVAVAVAGACVAIPILAALALGLEGMNELAPLVGFGVSSIAPAWVPIAVLLSVGAAWGLNHNHGLRSGGFVGAAYLGMLTAAPVQVVYMLAVGFLTYLIVTKLLMPWMILFGRRKFATMLLLSSVLSWAGMLAGERMLGLELSFYMTLSSVALLPLFLPGLVANDMERVGPLRVLSGVSIGGLFVVPSTWVVQDLIEHGVVSAPFVSVAFVAGAIVYSKQIRWIGQTVCDWLGIGAPTPAKAPVKSAPGRHIAQPAPAMAEHEDASLVA